ncbi:hypothetical protein T4E_4965 [Trichinella pseudospiralis]|uniref:Uncharacterized protein n=1 Tax=Trichinella pseudospiralis TaxID=6337 RepID=A0A0V0XPI7_TRIPS|nr:hypothetical protein T4E_4965 [Trichinella pseudospiralis]
MEQTSWWQLSASGSAFYVWGCWADVRGSQKSSVRIILLIHAGHMFVGDVMPSCLVHHKRKGIFHPCKERWMDILFVFPLCITDLPPDREEKNNGRMKASRAWLDVNAKDKLAGFRAMLPSVVFGRQGRRLNLHRPADRPTDRPTDRRRHVPPSRCMPRGVNGHNTGTHCTKFYKAEPAFLLPNQKVLLACLLH